MAELTIELVKEWLAANKDTDGVKGFLKELGVAEPKLSAEIVGPWLETDEGKRYINPLIDRRVNEGVRTHDAKTREANETEVKRRVAEELLKANPQETPQDKKIRELSEQIEKDRKEAARDRLKRAIVEAAAEAGVPSWWVDEYSGNTIEEAKLFLGKVKAFTDDVAAKAKNELMASGYKPGSGSGARDKKLDVSKLSVEELTKLEMDGKLNELLASG